MQTNVQESMRYPFTPYPDKSWFKLAFSTEVPLGKAVIYHYFGRDLVAYRDADGRYCLLDGSCPEHGEPLDRYDEGVLRCRFDRSDEGLNVAQGTSAAVDAGLKVWPSLERNQVLYVWYDVDNGQPTFEVPVIPEIDDPAWTGYNPLYWRKIRVHIQEIAENAVDLPHFGVLHDYHYTPIPNQVETVDNRLIVDVTSKRKILWTDRETDLHLEYFGMGCVVAHVDAPGGIELIAHLTPTPVDEQHIHFNVSIIFRKTGSWIKDRMILKFIMRDIKAELDRDIAVWERKAFFDTPVLCANDGPIGKLRRWARQFYPEVEGRSQTPGYDQALAALAVGADR